MEYFEITGGTPLHGSITLQGSKNAALPLMAASILHPGRTTLHHVPAIRDVDVMIEILENIGCTVQKDNGTLIIDAAKAEHFEVAASLGERMRSTIILLGSMLGEPEGENAVSGRLYHRDAADRHPYHLPWKDGSCL